MMIPETKNDDSPVQGMKKEHHRDSRKGFFRWWYALTAIPESVGENDPTKREIVRKSRLLSVIVFFLLVIFVMFAPACLFLPNPYVIVADLGMLVVCVLALILNRVYQPVLAGLLLTLAFEAALVMVVLTTMPLDEPSIQQYELFAFGELLAVSLLNARTVFFVAIFNSLFITASLLYQPHTPILDLDLQAQFLPMLARPVGVQLLVAGVTYLWVSSATTFNARASQAEIEATVARQEAEKQREQAEQERLHLQRNVERVVKKYAHAMNQRIITKIPISDYEPVLWPLINVFNSLQNRLQRTNKMEQDLQHLDQAITTCTEMIYEGRFFVEHSPHTKTKLDMLLAAVREQNRKQSRRDELSQEAPAHPFDQPQNAPVQHFDQYP